MAKERRDNKNRILSKGEYQKPDGRYMYRYTDAGGQTRFVYSWTLTKSDRTPKGRPSGSCLRDLEIQIERDRMDGILTHEAKEITYDSYFQKYLGTKSRLKETTRRNYRYLYDAHVKGVFGNRKISSIKYSEVKMFYTDLLNKGYSMNMVKDINIFFSPVFNMAVKDEHIRKNPANGVLKEVKTESGYVAKKKSALTVKEQEIFINYIHQKKKFNRWIPIMTFLLGTGCRVGETVGLTWENCDLENKVVKIRYSLSTFSDEYTGERKWKMLSPKTNAGVRDIPMFDSVYRLLLEEYKRQESEGFSKSEIDGHSGYVFFSRTGHAHSGGNIGSAISTIVNSYNSEEVMNASKEGRKPVLLPHITPHILRHTFCTRMCENGMNLKVLQDIMGHSDLSITMNIYTDATEDAKRKSFDEVEKKIKTA